MVVLQWSGRNSMTRYQSPDS